MSERTATATCTSTSSTFTSTSSSHDDDMHRHLHQHQHQHQHQHLHSHPPGDMFRSSLRIIPMPHLFFPVLLLFLVLLHPHSISISADPNPSSDLSTACPYEDYPKPHPHILSPTQSRQRYLVRHWSSPPTSDIASQIGHLMALLNLALQYALQHQLTLVIDKSMMNVVNNHGHVTSIEPFFQLSHGETSWSDISEDDTLTILNWPHASHDATQSALEYEQQQWDACNTHCVTAPIHTIETCLAQCRGGFHSFYLEHVKSTNMLLRLSAPDHTPVFTDASYDYAFTGSWFRSKYEAARIRAPKRVEYDPNAINIAIWLAHANDASTLGIINQLLSWFHTTNEPHVVVYIFMSPSSSTSTHPMRMPSWTMHIKCTDCVRLRMDHEMESIFHHLVTADIMISGNHSFTHFASVISRNIKLIMEYEPYKYRGIPATITCTANAASPDEHFHPTAMTVMWYAYRTFRSCRQSYLTQQQRHVHPIYIPDELDDEPTFFDDGMEERNSIMDEDDDDERYRYEDEHDEERERRIHDEL